MADIIFPNDTPNVIPSGSDRILISQTWSWWSIADSAISDLPVSTATSTALWLKVDKISWKGLSTNDFDNTEKIKVDNAIQNIIAGTNIVTSRSGNDVTINSLWWGWWTGNNTPYFADYFNATAGQTIFSLSFTYNPTKSHVFVFHNNWWFQRPILDFTEDWSNITLTSPADLWALITVILPNKWLNWQWAYSNIIAYKIDDAVSYLWSAYICTTNTTWNLPTNVSFWNLLVSKWDTGASGNIDWTTTTSLNGVLKWNWVNVSGWSTTADLPDNTNRRYLSDTQKTEATRNANTSQNWLISSIDWNTFNNKQSAWSYEVTTNKTTTFWTINDTLYPTVKAVNDQIISSVAWLMDFRGIYDASTNLFPSTWWSWLAWAILKADFWRISVAWTLWWIAVKVGNLVIALQDTPAQISANWQIEATELWYIPEDTSNKLTTTIVWNETNNIKFPTVKQIVDWTTSLFQPILITLWIVWNSTNIATAVANIDSSISDMNTNGIVSWGWSGNYYSLITWTFTLLRPATGRISGKLITCNASQTLSLFTANATSIVYFDSTWTLQKTTVTATALTWVRLFEILYDWTNYSVVREDHNYNFETPISWWFHNNIHTVIQWSVWSGTLQIWADITRVTTWTGWVATDRQLKIVWTAVVSDHWIQDVIPDSWWAAVVINWYYTNGSWQWIRQSQSATAPMFYNNAWTITALATSWANHVSIANIYVSKSDLNSATPVYFWVINNAAFWTPASAQTAINNGTFATQTNELLAIELAQLWQIILENNVSGGQIWATVTIMKDTVRTGTSTGNTSSQASSVNTNVTNFNGILTSSETTVQLALDRIDDFASKAPTVWTIIATAWQTAFTVPTYWAWRIQVYIEGRLQRLTTDYAETNFTTITMWSGIDLNNTFTYIIL